MNENEKWVALRWQGYQEHAAQLIRDANTRLNNYNTVPTLSAPFHPSCWRSHKGDFHAIIDARRQIVITYLSTGSKSVEVSFNRFLELLHDMPAH